MKTRVSGCISIWKSQTQTGWWLSVQWGRGRGGVNGTSIRRTCTSSLRDRFLFIKHTQTHEHEQFKSKGKKEEKFSLSLFTLFTCLGHNTPGPGCCIICTYSNDAAAKLRACSFCSPLEPAFAFFILRRAMRQAFFFTFLRPGERDSISSLFSFGQRREEKLLVVSCREFSVRSSRHGRAGLQQLNRFCVHLFLRSETNRTIISCLTPQLM